MLARFWHDEDGQALLYGAGVLVLIMACFFTAIDLGQAVLGRIQSQNAADAAALSASALKAGVHNTRELAYRAATGQLYLARMRQLKAGAIALDEIGGKNASQQQMMDALKDARKHRVRLEHLRDGILAFNQWAYGMSHEGAPMASEAVRAAAEIGYIGNLGVLGNVNRANFGLFENTDPLIEVTHKFSQYHMGGGVPYPGEALEPGHRSKSDPVPGKTLVVVAPQIGTPIGNAFRAFGLDEGTADASSLSFETRAAAGPVEATTQFGSNLPLLTQYGLKHWYVVRLMYIGKFTGDPANAP